MLAKDAAVDEEYLTIQEVAVLLRVGERTIYSLAREGRLPAMKIGNQWRIARSVLAKWAEVGGEVPPGMSWRKRGKSR